MGTKDDLETLAESILGFDDRLTTLEEKAGIKKGGDDAKKKGALDRLADRFGL